MIQLNVFDTDVKIRLRLNLGFRLPSGVLALGPCRSGGQLSLPGACKSGCVIHLDRVLVGLPFRADRFGTAFFKLPVPNDANLIGLTLCAQALRHDASCPVLSNGLEVRIGRGVCR